MPAFDDPVYSGRKRLAALPKLTFHLPVLSEDSTPVPDDAPVARKVVSARPASTSQIPNPSSASTGMSSSRAPRRRSSFERGGPSGVPEPRRKNTRCEIAERPRSVSTSPDASSGGAKPRLPSARLCVATSNLFKADKAAHLTTFSQSYSAGRIPFRIRHGCRTSISWDSAPEDAAFDPLLVHCCEGLRETQYPESFLARNGFTALLRSVGGKRKTLPLLPSLVQPLRAALSSPDEDVVAAGLQAIGQLVEVVGPALNDHLKGLMSLVARKREGRTLRLLVAETLQLIERHGGAPALLLIKRQDASYQSIRG
eukprot:jgi/Mesvir1/12176/Mv00419-RA.1